MKATIELRGSDVFCRSEDTQTPEQRLDQESALPLLRDWAQRYDVAVRADSGADTLRLIGRALWDWLDKPSGWAAAWSAGTGARVLDICVRPEALEDEAACALLDAPWELLAGPKGWLAEDAVQPFEVVRRIGAAATPRVAEFADLQMLFMAAAPEGQHVLSFEAEEAAILQATSRKPLHLLVEETGAAEWLQDRLVADAPFDVLHLSCHGDIDKRLGSVLLLEDDVGNGKLATAADLSNVIGDAGALPLLFLSACRTAERLEAGEEGRRRAAEPMVRDLIRAGVAHVLGWDGSVRDVDAAAFAEYFYDELAQGRAVALAAARARSKLLQTARTDPDRGAHWHLARLYVGARGGGPLIASQGKKRQHAGQGADRQFLDKQRKRVPVAGRGAFVGRRRVLQRVFRAFAEVDSGSGGCCGVLLHGMGNLGKSSVAARIASRLQRHLTVVVFERYDALAVLDGLRDAVPLLRRQGFMDEWRDAVRQDGGRLADALEALLDLLGSYHDGKQAAAPLLLIIDDLERILETPQPGDEAGVPVKAGDGRVALQAILTAFDRMAGRTASRLLLTSRYRFTLPDDWGNDLAERLIAVPLQPMSDTDQLKQWNAALRLLTTKAPADTVELRRLMLRAVGLAAGNPGLQEVLTRPLLSGELAVAERAMAAIEQFQKNGEIPADLRERVALPVGQLTAADKANTLLQFFRRMAFETYRAALTPDQAQQLRAATLFDSGLPVPRAALDAVGQKAGVADATAATDRLLGLGLLDDFGEIDGEASAGVNPLARPLSEPLTEAERPALADAALPDLARVWRTEAGAVPQDVRALVLCRLALCSPMPAPELLDRAATAAARWLFSGLHDAPQAEADVLQPARAKLASLQASPSHGFLHITNDVAERLGDRALQADTARQMAEVATTPAERAGASFMQARVLDAIGQREDAKRAFEAACDGFRQTGMEREAVIARGQIADILQSRGQLDEALRIRLEEQLPVFERLGDVREKAVTKGKIADILQSRGQLDEALRIRREEQLPVYERLGDVRSKAVTQGKVADILRSHGQLDEALFLLRKEVLSAFERLGDACAKAVTQGRIADILQARGQLDEALRIRLEEELPVYERLDNVREKAVTQGKIADILQARGQLDEALRIRLEEELPVFERLGNVRSKAVTQGKIADILQSRGQLDEALRIRLEEELPVYEMLGDMYAKAVTQGKIADILQSRGQLDEALALHIECLTVSERLGDIEGVAHARFASAQLRLGRGDHQTEGIQAIYADLAHSFAINQKLQRPDGIAFVGMLLARVLAMDRQREEALKVLDAAEQGFRTLGGSAGVGQIEVLRQQIGSMP